MNCVNPKQVMLLTSASFVRSYSFFYIWLYSLFLARYCEVYLKMASLFIYCKMCEYISLIKTSVIRIQKTYLKEITDYLFSSHALSFLSGCPSVQHCRGTRWQFSSGVGKPRDPRSGGSAQNHHRIWTESNWQRHKCKFPRSSRRFCFKLASSKNVMFLTTKICSGKEVQCFSN